MHRQDRTRFWGTIVIATLVYPSVFMFVFLLPTYGMEFLSRQTTPAGWAAFWLTVPFMAIATSYFIIPIALLFGAICAVVSRKTASLGLWVLRGMIAGGCCALISYWPVYLHFHSGWSWDWACLMTTISGLVAGGVTSLVTARWRPLAAQTPIEIVADSEVEIDTVAPEAEEKPATKHGSLAWLIVVYGLLGLMAASFIFIASTATFSGYAFRGFPEFGSLVVVLVGASLGLSPFSLIQSLLTGLFSGLISRTTPDTSKWLLYTALIGGGVWTISISFMMTTIILMPNRGFWSAIGISGLGHFVIGALSALVCALVCKGFRPRVVQTA